MTAGFFVAQTAGSLYQQKSTSVNCLATRYITLSFKKDVSNVIYAYSGFH